MKPHPRIRKAVKWGGAAMAAALAVVWFASAWWGAGFVSREFVCGLDPGQFIVKSGWDTGVSTRTRFESRWRKGFSPWGWTITWEADTHDLSGKPIFFWEGSCMLIVPLWMPIVFLGGLSAAAWRLDVLARRREHARRCVKCGYDRAGLAHDVVCPECGAAGMDPLPRSGAGQ